MLISASPRRPPHKMKVGERARKTQEPRGNPETHYSFSNCFRHSKYSNISPPLLGSRACSALLECCSALCGRLAKGKLNNRSGRGVWGHWRGGGGGGGNKGSGSEPRRRWRDQPLYARSSQGSWFTVAPAEVCGGGGGGWGGYFIYHFHFQLDPPHHHHPPPPLFLLVLAGSS